jgi:tetratricopeptide (TPR) repeat protein
MSFHSNTFILLFLITYSCFGQKFVGELSKTEFNLPLEKVNSFYEMYESKNGFLDFTGIKKGDNIAEIGAAQGMNLGIMSMFCDSVTFYAQDINAKSLSQKNLENTVEYYTSKRSSLQTNTFKRIIGTVSETGLPDNTFDKIFIIYSFHDFNKKDEMLDDLILKLKSTGKLIINDGFSFPDDSIKCYEAGCHVFTTLNTEIKRFEKHGLYLTQMRNPDYHASNYGNMVVYEKNKARSDEFYKNKNAIDPLVRQSFRLKIGKVASDSVTVKQISDSLFLKIKDIASVYGEYETWVKEIALKYLNKGENLSAINILKANRKLFPESYQSNYWLGVAYQENKQNDEALFYLKSSLSLNPRNTKASERIKMITR